MFTVNKMWDKFEVSVLKDHSEESRQEAKKIFYAGMMAGLTSMRLLGREVKDQKLSQDDAGKMMAELMYETDSFFQELLREDVVRH